MQIFANFPRLEKNHRVKIFALKTFFDNTLSRRKKTKNKTALWMPEISFQNLLKIEKRKKIVCVKLCRHRLIYFYLESLLLFVITSSKLECSKIHNCSYSVSFQCDKNKIEMTIKMSIMYRTSHRYWAKFKNVQNLHT